MTFALIYHDVAEPAERDRYGFTGAVAGRYKLTPSAFDAHLDAIASSGVTVGLVAERPQAALTFDDGGSSALWTATALERYGWRGHFFITTGRIGTAGFLDDEDVRELAARGHAVGSHSHSHPTYMGTLSRAQIASEWSLSRERLGEVLGAAPVTAAVPGGFLSPAVVQEAERCGYQLLMTSQPSARAATHGSMVVLGRHTIWADTKPQRAAAYARGARAARASLWLAWQAKTIPKRLSPRAYEAVRHAVATRGR